MTLNLYVNAIFYLPKGHFFPKRFHVNQTIMPSGG